MPSKEFKLSTLFFVAGLISGLLTIGLIFLLSLVMWIGAGLFLLLALVVSISIAARNRWISLNTTWSRRLVAALIVVAAHPISVLVMLVSLMLNELLYSRLFPQQWTQYTQSGSYPFSIWALYVAAVVGALLVTIALRVLTKKRDKQVLILLMLAGVITIPLSQAIASLIGEPNWHLVLFPVGEGLFGALCGYWLGRVSPVTLSGP